MEVDKIMRTLLTLGANSSTPRRHGSGQNNKNTTNTRQTRALQEDMEVDKMMRTLLTLGGNSSTPRRHGSGQNNENITNTRGKLEHYTKTWKWTK